MILIGSRAAKYHFSDWHRECDDTDYIIDQSFTHTKGSYELDYHYTYAFDWLLDRENQIASPNSLYTIKLSHSFWDVHWEKTMHDITFFKAKGCQIIEEFYNLLYSDWETIHGAKYNKLDLDQSLFLSLSNQKKLDFCWEQINSVMVEYYLEPSEFKMNKMVAYRRACKELITNLDSGWFPRFIVENWNALKKPKGILK